jgi:pimeloyl-ACP methyl ester carboxylesterase
MIMIHVKNLALAAALSIAIPAAFAQKAMATREFFYVGGKYAGDVREGQMYVEMLRPARVTRKYPIVFIHGASQTATNWIGTPDGRPGWADYFLNQGYLIYLVDQPARGRSPWNSKLNGPLTVFTVSDMEKRFTASEVGGFWPQARKHTQWPGDGPDKGRRGDPYFDAFYATQVQGLSSAAETQSLNQAAAGALLDKIGPAILLTHSQSGPIGWVIADKHPHGIQGIVSIEPSGPPFQNAVMNEDKNRAWGIADIPLTYDPPAKTPADLKPMRESKADGPDLTTCVKQSDPPRRLVKLQAIPILIVTTESSFHAVYDHCTAKYLTQAGVKNTYVRLEDQGIHGNGHMVMLEKNNIEVAAFLQKWIAANIK